MKLKLKRKSKEEFIPEKKIIKNMITLEEAVKIFKDKYPKIIPIYQGEITISFNEWLKKNHYYWEDD